MLDGVIDFDEAVRDPNDPEAMQERFLYQNDWLHLNAEGYATMGGCVDLSLFTKTDPLADDDEVDDYGQAIWMEAEQLRTATVGTAFSVVADAAASAGEYLLTVDNIVNAAPADSAHMLAARFDIASPDTYYIYARVNCPTWDDDSYWIGLDGPMTRFANGLQCGSWDWKQIYSGFLSAGSHVLAIGGREDGAGIDKLCIATNPEPPTGMGGQPVSTAIKEATTMKDEVQVELYSLNGQRLPANARPGLCIRVSRDRDGNVRSRQVVVLR